MLPVEGARHSASQELVLLVIQDANKRIELLEKIEINNITGQYHTSMLPRGCEKQRVIGAWRRCSRP